MLQLYYKQERELNMKIVSIILNDVEYKLSKVLIKALVAVLLIGRKRQVKR